MARSLASPRCLGQLLPLAIAISALTAGCGRREEIESCDINERSCQEDVYYAVVRARGDGFDPFDGVPPIRTITKQQYAEELFPDNPPKLNHKDACAPPEDEDAGTDKPPPEDDEDAGTDEPPPEPKIDPWDVSLQWLGLLQKSVSSGQAQSQDFLVTVAAFYTWDTQTVTIVTNPDVCKRNLRADTTLLAHELVHALQDNESDLTLSDGTIDGNWASNALIEGEARMYEYLIGKEIDDVSPYAVDWSSFFHSEVGIQRTAIAQRTSRLYSTWWFLYTLGTNALVERWLDGGNSSVRYFARKAPRRTIDYIHALDGKEVPPVTPLACRVELPGSTFQYWAYNRLGALNFYAFLLGTQLPEAEAWRAAYDWRDDQLFVYFDPEPKTVAVTWRLRFSTQATAELTVQAAETLPMLRAQRQGNDVVIVGSEATQADWPGAADCSKP